MGLFRLGERLILNESGLTFQDGKSMTIPWEHIEEVTSESTNNLVIGFGTMTIRSTKDRVIEVPLLTERLSDLLFQIKKRKPYLIHLDFNILWTHGPGGSND